MSLANYRLEFEEFGPIGPGRGKKDILTSKPPRYTNQDDVFPQFPLLPKELRLQIWTCALTPRVIPLHRSPDRTNGRGSYFPNKRMPQVYMALTTTHPSFSLIRRACPEAQVLCQKLYLDWEVWDIIKNRLGTPYNPESDIIHFSGNINDSVLLDFASRFPRETAHTRCIALPGVIVPGTTSRVDVLAALHAFKDLRTVIIVQGNGQSSKEPHSLWDGEGDMVIAKEPWSLPGSVIDALQRLKRDKWQDWTVPMVIVVSSWESIREHLSID